MSKKCANCGTELPENLVFCVECGRRLSPEQELHEQTSDTGVVESTEQSDILRIERKPVLSAPKASDEVLKKFKNDPSAQNILKKYGIRKFLFETIFSVVLANTVGFFVLSLPEVGDTMDRIIKSLLAMWIAFSLLIGPWSCNHYRKLGLKDCGYSKTEIKEILKQNPIFRTNGKARTDAGSLKKVGTVFSVIAWTFSLYGLFAAALPIMVFQLTSIYDFNTALLLKGLHILTAGFIAGFIGSVLKGGSK